MNSTDYYDNNAQIFTERTFQHDMAEIYNQFLALLPKKTSILDAGCGPGRDAVYFNTLGHDVIAFDASIEMVKISSQKLGRPTLQMSLQDITFENQFDGVWASASLLHVPFDELREVFEKIHHALKPNGILYFSFKYGHDERRVEGRTFYDMNETSILPYLEGLFEVITIWKTADTISWVAPSPANAWLRVLCKKC